MFRVEALRVLLQKKKLGHIEICDRRGILGLEKPLPSIINFVL